MGERRGFHAAAALTLAGAVLLTSGCSPQVRAGDSGDSAGRDEIGAIVQDIAGIRSQDIQEYARAFVERTAARSYGQPIELIGITPEQADDLLDPIGELRLSYQPWFDPEYTSEEELPPRCFAVTFDNYGPVGEWSGYAFVRGIGCPADAAVVTPEPDTRPILVVPDDARDVAVAVLTELAGSTPAADDVAAAIASRMTVPSGDREVLAEVRVVVDGESIGVAMGDASRCMMAARVDAAVFDVHLTEPQLQPGELGCRPETPLLDPDQLRAPH